MICSNLDGTSNIMILGLLAASFMFGLALSLIVQEIMKK